MCIGNGSDCGRVAVFCSSGQNEKLGANGAHDSQQIITPTGPGADGSGPGPGVFWPNLIR